MGKKFFSMITLLGVFNDFYFPYSSCKWMLKQSLIYIFLNEALGLRLNALHLLHASIEGQMQRPYMTIK